MKSIQQNQAPRFSRTKTFVTYFITWYYLMFSTLAYAGPGFFGDETNPSSKITVTRTLTDLQEDVIPSKTMQTTPAPPYFSSLQNIASNTFDWMRESALSRCDQFAKWIGSYAKDLPPSYFARSLLEIDYAHDEAFWQGHFNEAINAIKQAPFLGPQERAQLEDLQDIVWNGLLSPYAYDKKLQSLEKKSLFSGVRKVRDVFRSELKENPEVILQYVRKDLLNSLQEMQNNKTGTNKALLTEFKKKLAYYSRVMNAFDYAETLASLFLEMERNKGKLFLSNTQYIDFMGSLTEELQNISKKEYFQIKAVRESKQSVLAESAQDAENTLQEQKMTVPLREEHNKASSFFSYLRSFAKGTSTFVKRRVEFAIENPLQAITMGLALQTSAVAAKTALGLPPQFEIGNVSWFDHALTVPLNNGNAIVIWANPGLFGRVLNQVGTPMAAPFAIDTAARGGFSAIKYDTERLINGNIVVVYENENQILGRVMNAFGQPVTNSFHITSTLQGDSTFSPVVASLSNGNPFVAYNKYLSFSHQDSIRGRIMNSFGKPLTNELWIMNQTTGTFSERSPAITALNNGVFVVRCDLKSHDIYGRIMGEQGNPIANEFRINTRSSLPNCGQPSVTNLDNENVFVTWGADNKLVGRVINAKGNPMTNEFFISEEQGTKFFEKPSVNRLNSGNAFVAWSLYTPPDGLIPSKSNIYGRVMNAFGDPVTNPSQIDNEGEFSKNHFVSILNDGNVFVTWISSHYPNDPTLYGRIFSVE